MSLAIFAAPFENENDLNNSNINQKKSHNKTQKRYDNYSGNNTYNRANGIGYSNLETTSSKVKNVLQLIHNNMNDNDGDDDSGLGDFNPPEKPISAGVERTIVTEQMQNRMNDSNMASMSVYNKTASSSSNNYKQGASDTSNSYTPGTFYSSQAQPQLIDETDTGFDINSLKSNYGDKQTTEEFYKKYVPNYSKTSSPEESRYNNQVTKTQTSLAASPGGISPMNETILKKLNYMIHLLEESHDEKTGHVTEEVILYCFLGIFIIFIVDSFVKVGKYSR